MYLLIFQLKSEFFACWLHPLRTGFYKTEEMESQFLYLLASHPISRPMWFESLHLRKNAYSVLFFYSLQHSVDACGISCPDIWLFSLHLLINLFCSSNININPSTRDSSRTAAPAIHFFEEVPPSMPSQDSEEDSLPPHLLLPDSISQLEEFGQQKKWHKKHYKNNRQRQFNDLWVRIEDG